MQKPPGPMFLCQESAMERYARQIILPEVGKDSQERLAAGRVAVVGCGALGTVVCNHLVRAGVGFVRIIDRDIVELNNLQRQILFDEGDVAQGLPKAVAAARKLSRVNGQVTVEACVADVNPRNVEEMIRDVDLVLDGTDNFETRFLLNDACIKHRVPWIYAGVISTYGMTMTILPNATPCLRCLMPEMPPAGDVPTCDTVGVLSTAVDLVASLQATEALKLLMGRAEELHRQLIFVNAWTAELKRLDVKKGASACPACNESRYDFLEAKEGSIASRLCGKGALQIQLRSAGLIRLADLASRLRSAGQVAVNEYMLRFQVAPYEILVFPDGRVILKGTDDEALARTLCARYIGY